MIPYNDITAWGNDHPWPTREQVEQDLLLSQAICIIAKDPLLAKELVIRGGTAFHKLYLPKPLRYSEDLDFVRTTSGGIADITHALTSLGEGLGFRVRTKIVKYPKIYWHTTAQTGDSIKIKIEINTFERSPALAFVPRELLLIVLIFSVR
jgi:predicted nucleotidyltransferase component of viral defense system